MGFGLLGIGFFYFLIRHKSGPIFQRHDSLKEKKDLSNYFSPDFRKTILFFKIRLSP